MLGRGASLAHTKQWLRGSLPLSRRNDLLPYPIADEEFDLGKHTGPRGRHSKLRLMHYYSCHTVPCLPADEEFEFGKHTGFMGGAALAAVQALAAGLADRIVSFFFGVTGDLCLVLSPPGGGRSTGSCTADCGQPWLTPVRQAVLQSPCCSYGSRSIAAFCWVLEQE